MRIFRQRHLAALWPAAAAVNLHRDAAFTSKGLGNLVAIKSRPLVSRGIKLADFFPVDPGNNPRVPANTGHPHAVPVIHLVDGAEFFPLKSSNRLVAFLSSCAI